jgi:hypothetical protein
MIKLIMQKCWNGGVKILTAVIYISVSAFTVQEVMQHGEIPMNYPTR